MKHFPDITAEIKRSSIVAQIIRKCETEIERNYVRAFDKVARMWGFDLNITPRGPNGIISIEPQVWIGRYRADLLFTYLFHGFSYHSIVECDGHEFHEKTKAQAARDKKRDRYLQSEGYPVLRFTGSEIYRDPQARAMEVLNSIMDFQTASIMHAMSAANGRVA